MRKALQWNPEDQATALELLQDEWMNSNEKLGTNTGGLDVVLDSVRA
jgi:hypothetical protein